MISIHDFKKINQVLFQCPQRMKYGAVLY